MMLLGQKAVQQELKLSDEQVKQIDEQLAKQRESFQGFRDLSPEERQKRFAESGRAAAKPSRRSSTKTSKSATNRSACRHAAHPPWMIRK